jgi:hypothetical protein
MPQKNLIPAQIMFVQSPDIRAGRWDTSTADFDGWVACCIPTKIVAVTSDTEFIMEKSAHGKVARNHICSIFWKKKQGDITLN